MLENAIHLVGNLTADPEHYAAAGASHRTTFRIAASERRFDKQTQAFVDGSTLFMDVVTWRDLADHVYATLHKGDRVVVVGRLRRREYTNQQQEQRSRLELEADAVGPDLRNATAVVSRTSRRASVLVSDLTDDAPLPPEPQDDFAADTEAVMPSMQEVA